MKQFGSFVALTFGALACILVGCVSSERAANVMRATDVPPEVATVDYWLQKPATSSVSHADYAELWSAAERAVAVGFEIDRHDYRAGVLTTHPVVSAQFFEFWRGDAVEPANYVESSIAGVRRRVRFSMYEKGSKFLLEPRVVTERLAVHERPLLTAKRPKAAFSAKPVGGKYLDEQGNEAVDGYWYATGRDHELERQLAERVRAGLPTRSGLNHRS